MNKHHKIISLLGAVYMGDFLQTIILWWDKPFGAKNILGGYSRCED